MEIATSRRGACVESGRGGRRRLSARASKKGNAFPTTSSVPLRINSITQLRLRLLRRPGLRGSIFPSIIFVASSSAAGCPVWPGRSSSLAACCAAVSPGKSRARLLPVPA